MKADSDGKLVTLCCSFSQFLEQKYGYYHCKDCNIRWESAYVWCVQGTNKVSNALSPASSWQKVQEGLDFKFFLCPIRFTTSSFAEHARSLITLTEWRISPAKIVNRLDAPAQWNFSTWTPKGPTVKICVGDAKANAYLATALSVSNISFKWM